MALVLKDRVKETTTTTGTGTYTLAGAVAGFEAFSSVGDGNTTYYACTDGTDFEVGIGTYTSSGTTLARTTILQSSNSDSAVSWSSGTRTIFCTQPADKAVFKDGDDVVRTEVIEPASGITYDPPGSSGSDTATDVAIALLSGKRIVMGYNGYIRTILDAEWGQPMQIGAHGTSAFASTEIYGGSVGVKLHYSSNQKLETTSGGINVTGTVTDDGATHDGDVTFTGASYNVVWDKSDNAFELADNATLKFGAGNDMEIFSDGTYGRINVNNLIIRGDDTDNKPALYFQDYNTSDVVDYDTTTNFYFQGRNSANEQVTYNTIQAISLDVTDGTEDGRIQFAQLEAGTSVSTFIFDAYYFLLNSEQQILWYQYNGSYNTALLPTTPTANRTITLPDASGEVVVTDSSGVTTLSSTANGGSILKLVSDDPSDATDWHVENEIQFFAENDASESVEYANIRLYTADVSDGTEDGWLYFGQMFNGTLANRFAMGPNSNFYLLGGGANDPAIEWNATKGTSYDVQLKPATPSADRTITLPDATGTVQLTDGSGASLTSLNASQLSSGTVPNARLDAQLQDVAGLAVTNGNFIVGDGSNFVAESGATARTSLGLGTAAVLDTGISNTNIPKFTSGVADDDFLRVNGTDIEGRSASEVLSDIAAMPLAGGTFTGDVTLTDTDTGSSEGPVLTLNRDSSSPADSDFLGTIKFNGDNDAGESITYSQITTKISDNTDGTEDGNIIFKVYSAGTQNASLTMKGNATIFNNRDVRLDTGVNLLFEGATSNANETTLTVTDPTADRTITLPDATGTVLLTDGSGASLTSLNASELGSGTVPNARLDAQLQDVAGLAVTNGGFIVGDGSNFVLETGATARTSLGLGTAAVAATGISNGNVAVFTSGAADNDFLRIDGTSIEGRSASEVLSDIGATTAAAAADEATALAIALG